MGRLSQVILSEVSHIQLWPFIWCDTQIAYQAFHLLKHNQLRGLPLTLKRE